MVDRLESRVDLLSDNPRLGAELSVDDFPFLTPGYRRLIVKPFILYYRIIDEIVFITHIVHERQDQKKALRETDSQKK
jgi:toxin ParE1/3/4